MRPMSAAMQTALQAGDLRPVIFVQLAFAEETVYLWSGIGSVAWNGQTWVGLGALLGLTVAEDSATVEAKGITVTLSGLDATLLPECINDFRLGLPAVVSFGLYGPDGAIISQPLTTWAGRTDQPTVDVDTDQVTMAINCESRLIDMNIAVDRRLTNQDQQMDHPGDLGLQFVDGLQEMTLYWGQVPTSTTNI